MIGNVPVVGVLILIAGWMLAGYKGDAMFWVFLLLIIGVAAVAGVAYITRRNIDFDLPDGHHPPGDHTAEWLDEHRGAPRRGPK